MNFKELACVIIPVYNHPKTLLTVAASVLEAGYRVIIVDDGSIPSAALLVSRARLLGIEVVSHVMNQGKGMAILTGARAAKERGYKFFITMDADLQHYTSDLEHFAEAFCEDSGVMMIGVRDFKSTSVPRSSKIGRFLGNFWVFVETGFWVRDTQSGFRLYPVTILEEKYYSRRYEFEVEVIVKHLWRGGAVTHVDISTIYPNGRVSHFDKLKDNWIMTKLHARLVFLRWICFRGWFR